MSDEEQAELLEKILAENTPDLDALFWELYHTRELVPR